MHVCCLLTKANTLMYDSHIDRQMEGWKTKNVKDLNYSYSQNLKQRNFRNTSSPKDKVHQKFKESSYMYIWPTQLHSYPHHHFLLILTGKKNNFHTFPLNQNIKNFVACIHKVPLKNLRVESIWLVKWWTIPNPINLLLFSKSVTWKITISDMDL